VEFEMSDSARSDGTREKHTRAWLAACWGTAADRRNQIRFMVWTFAWAVVFLFSTALLRGRLAAFGLQVGGTAAWLVASVPIVVAVGALRAYLRFLRMADELTRLIQLQGLAVGFGVGVIFLLGWELFEAAGARSLDAGDAVAVLVLAWVLGQLYGTWRFR
jgi:hypothetical protein